MKKYLLMATALMTSVAMFADTGWTEDRRFTPVTASYELSSIHTTVAADGSVYASSSITTEMTFGGKTLTPTADGSTCVVKYDKEGNEQWAILFSGSNSLRAMTVDATGNLYVAGTVTGEATEFIGTDGNSKTITNPTKYDDMWGEYVVTGKAGYIVKVTADGAIAATQSVSPVGPEATVYYGEPRVNPNKIVVDGSNVYVSCFYAGSVESLGWEGRYTTCLNFDTFETDYYGDLSGAGVFSVSSSDLSGVKNVANLKATADYDILDDGGFGCSPDAFSFVAKSGFVGVAFIGWGNLTLSTPTQSVPFSFDRQGNGLNEHALVLSMLTDIEHASLTYHSAAQDNEYPEYNLFGEMVGTDIILGGTFSGQLPLDNSKYSKSTETENKYKNAAFIASITPMSNTVNYALPVEAEEESYATGLIVTGEESHLGTENAVYHYKTADGANAGEPMDFGVLDGAQINDEYVSIVYTEKDKTDVRVYAIPMGEASAVEAVKAADAAGAKYYTIDGVEIAAPQQGISLVKTADGVKKIVK
ncbi:MAG: hypothetical protein IJ782_03815 [Prevotella sp.]|nr:hypothetical protein [Prevotella sp.]